MRRALPLLLLTLAMSFATACADIAGPANDDDCEGVVVGSQTRCEDQ